MDDKWKVINWDVSYQAQAKKYKEGLIRFLQKYILQLAGVRLDSRIIESYEDVRLDCHLSERNDQEDTFRVFIYIEEVIWNEISIHVPRSKSFLERYQVLFSGVTLELISAGVYDRNL